MESNKQERKNLVDDNPVAKEASALKNVNKGYGQEVKSPMAMMKNKKPSKFSPPCGRKKCIYNYHLICILNCRDRSETASK